MTIEYNQLTGRTVVRRGNVVVRAIGVGYAGRQAGLNNPEMEHARNIGPIPKGTYFLREVRHKRFASPAFQCVPTVATAAKLRQIGRGDFWVHGDNAKQDKSASSGCIILSHAERLAIKSYVERGHTHLTVV